MLAVSCAIIISIEKTYFIHVSVYQGLKKTAVQQRNDGFFQQANAAESNITSHCKQLRKRESRRLVPAC